MATEDGTELDQREDKADPVEEEEKKAVVEEVEESVKPSCSVNPQEDVSAGVSQCSTAQQAVIRMLCEAVVSTGGPQSQRVLTRALAEAAKHGDIRALEALADSGAPVTLRPMYGDDTWSPVEWAACRGHVSVIEVLAQRGALMTARAVDLATSNNQAKAVESLARHGAPLGTADCGGWTPVHAAAMNGHAAVLEALARCGASLRTSDNCDRLPAHHAANNGHVLALEVLKRMGAPMDKKDSSGATPADLASYHAHATGRLAASEFLAKHDLEPSQPKGIGESLWKWVTT